MPSRSRGQTSIVSTIIFLLLLAAVYYFSSKGNNTVQTSNPTGPNIPASGNATQAGPVSYSSYPWGKQAKTSGCVSQNALPDSQCTPGDVLKDVTSEQICQSGYAKSVRNVPESEKNQAYSEYGIASHTAGQYEVDHLVSLELGGSNDISNLWPEPANPTPGFHEKDKVENYLHDQVCSGKISLQDAQIKIATDWMSVYNTMSK